MSKKSGYNASFLCDNEKPRRSMKIPHTKRPKPEGMPYTKASVIEDGNHVTRVIKIATTKQPRRIESQP